MSNLDGHHTEQYIPIDDYLRRERLGPIRIENMPASFTNHTIYINPIFLHKVPQLFQPFGCINSCHISS